VRGRAFARDLCARIETIFLIAAIVVPQFVVRAPGATRAEFVASFAIFMGVALLARVGRTKLGVYKSNAV
jgi:hypothetical protein